jgi:putative ABC transport system permease protein
VEPLSKFSLLSLKRAPFRFFSSVICLGGAVSIIFASLSFLVAKNDVIIQAFERFMHYDGQVVFASEPEESLEEEIRGIPDVAAAERYWASEREISFGEKIERTTLFFLEPGTTMISLMDLPGNPLDYPTEGIMLNSGFAKNIGAAPGDVVTIDGREYPVTGIARQTLNFQFMPASARTDFADGIQTGWMVCLRQGTDGAALSARMAREDGYVTTLWKSLMRKGLEELYVNYDLYTWLLIILCGLVGAFIVVNTGRNNLNEQKLSLSVLRAMGFQHRDISIRWFLQSLLFFLSSLAIGLPVGRVMADICLDMLRTAERDVRYIHSLFQYAWTAGLIFVFLVIAHLITVQAMRKWDLVENTKGRE